VPEVRGPSQVLLELERAAEKADRVLELVPARRQLSGAREPCNRPVAQVCRLVLVTTPGEVRVLRADRLAVVVRKERRSLVPERVLEPAREGCVETRAAGLGQALVRDLPCERVLDRVFAFAGHGRAGPAAYEVALLEDAEVGLALDELVHRPGPEDPADRRRRLECLLLRLLEQVDPGGEHGLDRIRDREVRRELRERPAAVVAPEQVAVDQRREQLLDERVALSPLGDDIAQRRGEISHQQLVDHPHRVLRRERLEADDLGPSPGASAGTAVEDFRAGRRQQQQRAAHVLD